MKLYIAEKKNVADVMAEYLFGKDFATFKKARYYKKGDTVVTWAMGHVLEMAPPSHYGAEKWTDYPVMPENCLPQKPRAGSSWRRSESC